jgi:hypothetical protein
MAPEQTPDDFDWVGPQSACNAKSMFTRLQSGVKHDVERRNGISDRDDGWRFEFHEDADEFEVSRVVEGGQGKESAFVTFDRQGRRIHVHGDGVDVEFTAIVSLDVTGKCRFIVGEAEYSQWEIRRMALEQLFFEEEAD